MQAAFAKNKVEAFAFVKGTGILGRSCPHGTGGFPGDMQYVLGVFPNPWAVKGMLQLMPVGHTANLVILHTLP